MGDAQRGDDAIAFFAAWLGSTRALQVSSGAAVQFPTVDRELPPGRYLLHVDNFSGANARMWVRMGPFGMVLAAPAAPPSFPMSPNTIVAIEVNVVKGANDQVAARMSGGAGATGTLYVTQISRGA